MTLGEKAVALAKQSIGVKETSPNWGEWVQVYLKFVGISVPAPWCAAFVAYKVHEAADALGISSIWPKIGYVQGVVDWAKQHSVISTLPVGGRIFVVYEAELKRYAHTGFIADVRGAAGGGWEFLTVEGNSNTTGSREGIEVVSMWRPWDTARHKSIQIV